MHIDSQSTLLKSFLFLIVILCIFFLLIKKSPALEVQKTAPVSQKEVVKYDIKNFGLDVGNASIVNNGLVEIEGRQAMLIVFTAEAMNFFDEERIFVDSETFLPIIIKRDLNIFGKKEKIKEEYLRDKGIIKVTKNTGDKTETFEIEKKGDVENIYGFIFRYRKEGKLKIGEKLDLILPTKDVKINLVKEMKLNISGKSYDTFYMQSEPKQYKIWFENSERKVPLRIDGTVGFGKTSMIFKEYSSAENKNK